jgi:hypothetical protein
MTVLFRICSVRYRCHAIVETTVLTRATLRNISEDGILHIQTNTYEYIRNTVLSSILISISSLQFTFLSN